MIVADGRLGASLVDILGAGSTMKNVDEGMLSLKRMSVTLEQETLETTPYVRTAMVVVSIGVGVIALFVILSYFRRKK